MRAWLAMLTLCVIAAIMISEPHYSSSLPKNDAQTQAQADSLTTKTPEHDHKTGDNSANSDDNSPKWYTAFKRPEWWLVILGFPTLGFIGWQAWEAKKAAEATEKNTELYINRERARLRVEMTPFIYPSTSDSAYDTVDFRVTVYGQTDAFITDSGCVAGVGPEEFIDYPDLFDKVMFPISSLPSVVIANANPKECWVFLGVKVSPDNFLLQEVKAKRMFVCIRGFIKYKDVFERERETTFRYVWQYSEVVEDYGQWKKCGKPEENHET